MNEIVFQKAKTHETRYVGRLTPEQVEGAPESPEIGFVLVHDHDHHLKRRMAQDQATSP